MLKSSAASQKILKILTETEEDHLNSLATTIHSLEDVIKDLQNIVKILFKTLKTLRLPYIKPKNSQDISELTKSLTFMIPIICNYSKIEPHQIQLYSCDEELKEINVTIRNSEDLISKIFNLPSEGLFLSSNDCKDLAALIMGAIRDSSSNELKKKIKKIEEKAIEYGNKMLKYKKLNT